EAGPCDRDGAAERGGIGAEGNRGGHWMVTKTSATTTPDWYARTRALPFNVGTLMPTLNVPSRRGRLMFVLTPTSAHTSLTVARLNLTLGLKPVPSTSTVCPARAGFGVTVIEAVTGPSSP